MKNKSSKNTYLEFINLLRYNLDLKYDLTFTIKPQKNLKALN